MKCAGWANKNRQSGRKTSVGTSVWVALLAGVFMV
jgi:hypothetical protein